MKRGRHIATLTSPFKDIRMFRSEPTRRDALRLLSAAAAGFLMPLAARSQAPWPNRAIRFVVPFAPGGSSEIVARTTAVEMAKLLGQSVYVDNKPGAAGNVAMGEVARAVGYKDATSFSRSFRRHYGVAPREAPGRTRGGH